MLPPGLAFLALSERAHEQRKRANIPNFYFNLNAEDKAAKTGETAWTPAVGLICGLDVVLAQMKKSGLPPIFSYYARLAEATRRGLQAMGSSFSPRVAHRRRLPRFTFPSPFRTERKLFRICAIGTQSPSPEDRMPGRARSSALPISDFTMSSTCSRFFLRSS